MDAMKLAKLIADNTEDMGQGDQGLYMLDRDILITALVSAYEADVRECGYCGNDQLNCPGSAFSEGHHRTVWTFDSASFVAIAKKEAT